jgi:hypothetical protein
VAKRGTTLLFCFRHTTISSTIKSIPMAGIPCYVE